MNTTSTMSSIDLTSYSSPAIDNLSRIVRAAYPSGFENIIKLQRQIKPDYLNKLYAIKHALSPLYDNIYSSDFLKQQLNLQQAYKNNNINQLAQILAKSDMAHLANLGKWEYSNRELSEETINLVEEVISAPDEYGLDSKLLFEKLTVVLRFCYDNKIAFTLLSAFIVQLFIIPHIINPLKENLGTFAQNQSENKFIENNITINHFYGNENDSLESMFAILDTPFRTQPRKDSKCIHVLNCGSEVWVIKKNRKWMFISYYSEEVGFNTGWVLIEHFE